MKLNEVINQYERCMFPTQQEMRILGWLKELRRMMNQKGVVVWVAKEALDPEHFANGHTFLFTKKPKQIGSYFSPSEGDAYCIPDDLIPDLTFESSPRKVVLRVVGGSKGGEE
jgi:hypothetical protein